MTTVVADTVAIVWWMSDDARLSATAAAALQAADDSDGIYVSAITLLDIWYAIHKRSDALSLELLADLNAAIDDVDVNIHVLPVTDQVGASGTSRRALCRSSSRAGNPAAPQPHQQ